MLHIITKYIGDLKSVLVKQKLQNHTILPLVFEAMYKFLQVRLQEK